MTLAFQDSALPEPELRDAYQIAAKHVPAFARAFNAALTKILQNAMPSDAQWTAFANMLWPLYLPSLVESKADARESLKRRRVVKARKEPERQPAPVVQTSVRAVNWAKTRSANLVVNIRSQTRQTIRDAISAGVARGSSVRDVADQLHDVLPLLPQHAQAVRNLQTELTLAKESPKKIKKKVDAYIEALKAYRAENVARTATVSAQAEGRLEAWKDAQEAGELPSNVVRVWVSAPSTSKRLCQICAELDGQEPTLDDGYTSSDLGAVARPPAHPSCRCTEILRVSKVEKKVEETLVEKFDAILREHARVALVGGPRTGKTTLSSRVLDRYVSHTDDFIDLPWADVPSAVISSVAALPKFLVEGVQVARSLRKGLSVDAVVWLSDFVVPVNERQRGMAKSVLTVLREWCVQDAGKTRLYVLGSEQKEIARGKFL